ncbi:hypothetical protein DQ04_03531020 [Trypanosoma grayi]|uniref:hypothetical protein n=1 Tax=Trypanosoma grayi TaxID=71804 RepID=UPI0004F41952|nr:hypothetical protein DQ04_03531020 [Trypanosoma grayi]KEG10591.1 hypothetical protein DQ04_03531020 [Trypanosoma grayi]
MRDMDLQCACLKKRVPRVPSRREKEWCVDGSVTLPSNQEHSEPIRCEGIATKVLGDASVTQKLAESHSLLSRLKNARVRPHSCPARTNQPLECHEMHAGGQSAVRDLCKLSSISTAMTPQLLSWCLSLAMWREKEIWQVRP